MDVVMRVWKMADARLHFGNIGGCDWRVALV